MNGNYIDGRICQKERCFHCCIETEMIISKTDLKRINQQTGLTGSEYTTMDSEKRRVLKNKSSSLGKICYFLSERGECIIYNIRPQGCRYYPIIWNFYNHQAFSDDYCPHHKQFDNQIPRISSVLELFILKLYGEV